MQKLERCHYIDKQLFVQRPEVTPPPDQFSEIFRESKDITKHYVTILV